MTPPTPHPAASAAPAEADLDWLLEDFLRRTPGVIAAVLGTRDGLCKASAGLPKTKAQYAAAVMSGMFASTNAVGKILDSAGNAQQSVHEHDAGTLFVVSAGEHQDPAFAGPAPRMVACLLGVLAAPDADAGLIGYEQQGLVRRMPDHLSTSTRGSGQ